ncbi:OmpA family protein [Filimonas effusa]|uniref:OmpA family protein n=1 Tax=Filimonas effusa TaxID=2508721 RepID=A0A4Q1D3V9_9BACT|nr:OmpA family protein [Filimonas effusa]RXK83018.1 OmpA family protein [Filimonas effusa]
MKTLKMSVTGLLSAVILFSSCKTWNNSQKGAAVGVGGGAAAGAVIGKISGNTALGTIIGAAVGGTAGAIIGRKMDKQAEDIKTQVPDAKVERVNEGITVEFSSKVLFGFDSYSLTDASRGSLDKLIKVLNTYPDTNVEVQGHTDNKGTAAYNDKLSLQRAESVASYVKSHGIASSRITTRGFGFNAPKYTNDTEDGRAQNRRVEFVITANEKMKSEAAQQANQ